MKNGICIQVSQLRKTFGGIKAVDGISFQVAKGSIFGMLGPNGAGKSTTIETLIGLQARDSGKVEILGLDPEKDQKQLKQLVGVQLQSPALFGKLKVKELIALFASFYPQPLPVQQVIGMVSLEEKKESYTETLSGGERHRLAVALAVVGDAPLIFLDEPTTGLDPQSRRNLWDVIENLKEEGKTLFLTTHYMDEAEKLCDHLLILDRGHIITQGAPGALIKEYFQEDALEFENPSLTQEQIEELSRLSHVTRLHVLPGEVILLYSRKVVSTLAHLLSYTQGLDKAIDGLKIRKPTLEDLFLSLTGRKIR